MTRAVLKGHTCTRVLNFKDKKLITLKIPSEKYDFFWGRVILIIFLKLKK